jgi:hypothetical protein
MSCFGLSSSFQNLAGSPCFGTGKGQYWIPLWDPTTSHLHKKEREKKKKKKKKALSAYVDIKRHAEGLAKVKIQIQDVSSEMLIFKLIKYNKYNYLINT